MKNLVFTFSGKAGSGKDTAAEMLVNYLKEREISVFEMAYADYLKALCKRNFGYDDNDKENGRHILQKFGTDVVRESDPIIWVETVFNMIDTLRDSYDVFVITDARFENELQPHPWKLGYPIFNILVQRETEGAISDENKQHSSEDMANNPDNNKFHFILHNDGTLDDLKIAVIECYNIVEIVRNHFMEELEKGETESDKIATLDNEVTDGEIQ